MKMLFFSSDETEVKTASQQFTTAGIPCEVRNTPVTRTEPPDRASAELWIRNDKDCHRALMLCVQLGIGFARRPHRVTILDDDDSEPAESLAAEME